VFSPRIAQKIWWKNEGQLINGAYAAFRTTGELAGFGGPLAWGVMSEEGTAYWFVAVRNFGGSAGLADATRHAAEEAGLATSIWERPSTGATVLLARARTTTQAAHEEATAWFALASTNSPVLKPWPRYWESGRGWTRPWRGRTDGSADPGALS